MTHILPLALQSTKSSLPPDPEDMNEMRAEWAQYALDSFQEMTGADEDDYLSDLLTNLRHWADRNGQDFNEQLARAMSGYEEETAG